ncbi:MAG: hypothetical protein VX589_08570 [Myxococcota bacterium]|nr:hypothetical protein [Myxococcota bacterium]
MTHLLRWICLAVCLGPSALAQVLPSAAETPQKASVDGRLSNRALYSWDNGDASQQVLIAFFETDVRAQNLTSWSTGLVLDATFIGDLTEANERRFGETETIQRVRQLYIIHPGIAGRLDVSVGRRLITEAGNGWVDGVDTRYRLSPGMHLGLYGGLRPDQNDFSVTTDYQTAGTYFTMRLRRFDADIAYNAVVKDGLDRQFVFFRTHAKLAEKLFVSTYAVADLQENSDLTTVIGTVDYSPTQPLNLTLTYSRYSLEQYRDTVIYRNVIEPNQALILGDEIINLVYNRLRLTSSARFWRRFYVYQSVEYKRRSQDNLDAWLYTIGARDDDFMGWGTRVDVRSTFRNNFRSDSWLLALDVDHDLTRSVSVNLRATRFDGRTIDRLSERGRTFDEAQRIFLIGGGLYWRASRSHLFTFDYDGIYETDLVDQRNDIALFIHTMMTRYAYYF